MCAELRVVPEAATHIIQGLQTTPHKPEQRDSLIAALSVVVFEFLSADFVEGSIRGLRWVKADRTAMPKKMATMAEVVGGKATKAEMREWLKHWQEKNPPYHARLVADTPKDVGLFSVTDSAGEPFWRRDRMRHPGVDYLADARVRSFENWKAHMLRSCDRMEAA